MKRIKKSIISLLLVMVIAGFVPVAAFAQITEVSGLIFTPFAGTIPEGDWRIEVYSGFYIGQILDSTIENFIDSFILKPVIKIIVT